MAWEWGEKWWWGVVLGREMQRKIQEGDGERKERRVVLVGVHGCKISCPKGALYQ